jgi:hypothetical protein
MKFFDEDSGGGIAERPHDRGDGRSERRSPNDLVRQAQLLGPSS